MAQRFYLAWHTKHHRLPTKKIIFLIGNDYSCTFSVMLVDCVTGLYDWNMHLRCDCDLFGLSCIKTLSVTTLYWEQCSWWVILYYAVLLITECLFQRAVLRYSMSRIVVGWIAGQFRFWILLLHGVYVSPVMYLHTECTWIFIDKSTISWQWFYSHSGTLFSFHPPYIRKFKYV